MQFMSNLRQNYQKTSKSEASKIKNNKNAKPSSSSKPLKNVCLYHMDCIYQGTVNASHYREGFGILQSSSFHNFLGNFKNGRAEGLGLIILNSGARIYGNFIKDQLNGMGLIDDGKYIKLGVWSKWELNGIGYVYDGQKYLWKMVKFYKSSVIEVIKQEASSLQGKVPALINLQHSLYILLNNFLQNQYFPTENSGESQIANQNENHIENNQNYSIQNQSKKFIHFQGPRVIYFGSLESEKQQGLGIKFDISDKSVTQTGFYQSGKIHGYGFKNNNTIKFKEMGFYIEGNKQGLFLHDDGKQATFCLYRQNNYLEPLQINGRQVLRKKQRQYNYSKKEFLSQKNTLDLDQYESLVSRTCQKREMYLKPNLINRNSNDQGEQVRGENSRRELDRILGVKVKEEVTKSRLRENDIKMNEATKTSLSVLKQKFKYFQIINSGVSDENHQNHKDNSQRVQVNKKVQDENNQRVEWKDHREYLMSKEQGRRRLSRQVVEQHDQIAQEENPFVFGVSQNEYVRKMMSSHERVEKHWM